MARTSRALLTFVAVAGFASAVPADVIKLKNGGEIRGTIPRKAGTLLDETVTIETLGGGVVILDRKDIQFITWRSPAVEEFETKVREVSLDDLDALRELVEWCREKGLTDQRRTILERIIELEPDDPDARAALGHSRYDGRWMSRDERMQSQGYVKHKGRYITRQELDLIQKTVAQRKAEQAWFPKVRSSLSWIEGRNLARQEEGLAQLRAIDDPAALPALDRFLSSHADRAVRALYVDLLDRLPGEAPVSAIVEKSLHDADREIRWRALNALDREQYAAARPIYVRELKSDLNVVVRRAARALERVGDESSIPDLIAALVTSHRYQVRVPANDAMSFNTNGTFSLGGSPGASGLSPELQSMLLSGQFPNGVIVMPNQPAPQVRTRVVRVRVNQQNPESLTALQKLTGENHGYDARTWQLWWAAHKAQLDGPTVQ